MLPTLPTKLSGIELHVEIVRCLESSTYRRRLLRRRRTIRTYYVRNCCVSQGWTLWFWWLGQTRMNPPDEVPEARVNGQTSAVRSSATSTSKPAPTTTSASGRSRKVVHTFLFTHINFFTQLNSLHFFRQEPLFTPFKCNVLSAGSYVVLLSLLLKRPGKKATKANKFNKLLPFFRHIIFNFADLTLSTIS